MLADDLKFALAVEGCHPHFRHPRESGDDEILEARRRLAVALHAISTICSGFNVLPGTFNRIAGSQKKYRAANCENFQKIFHCLSPTARANYPSFEFRYFDNSRSQRSFHCVGRTLAEAFKMIAGLGKE